jgi:hypothetical protein
MPIQKGTSNVGETYKKIRPYSSPTSQADKEKSQYRPYKNLLFQTRDTQAGVFFQFCDKWRPSIR